jgi:3-hydroxymyristoyl/3-hydroxydecanoyl-(acyl carrier protein) dehydratase
MSSPLLFDISNLDITKVVRTTQDIEKVNPHRAPMRVIDAFVYVSENLDRAIAYKDIGPDEIWASDLLQNAMMLEAGGQVSSYITLIRKPDTKFMGFTGITEVKIHGHAKPGDRIIYLAKEVEFRSRRTVFAAQGLVNHSVIFQGIFSGMSM